MLFYSECHYAIFNIRFDKRINCEHRKTGQMGRTRKTKERKRKGRETERERLRGRGERESE